MEYGEDHFVLELENWQATATRQSRATVHHETVTVHVGNGAEFITYWLLWPTHFAVVSVPLRRLERNPDIFMFDGVHPNYASKTSQ
jgi:hypothetical protein